MYMKHRRRRSRTLVGKVTRKCLHQNYVRRSDERVILNASIVRTWFFFVLSAGVRLGGGLRVAPERRGQSRAVHPVRGADGPPRRYHQQDGVAQTVRDHRSETHHVHYDDAVCPLYGHVCRSIRLLTIRVRHSRKRPCRHVNFRNSPPHPVHRFFVGFLNDRESCSLSTGYWTFGHPYFDRARVVSDCQTFTTYFRRPLLRSETDDMSEY